MTNQDSIAVLRERPQKTLKNPVEYSGIGIHSGKKVHMRFLPQEVDFGVQFCRTDLPGRPLIPAAVENVVDTTRSTTIGTQQGFVQTVEHVLSALKAYEIDNALIEVSDKEPPIATGGSDVFVEMIEKSGVVEQKGTVPILSIQEPIFWSNGECNVAALPYKGLRFSYTLNYPKTPLLQNQFYSVELTPESFKAEIAPCRTFALYEEVEFLIDQGLIKGGSLANTVIIKGDEVFSKEGLHMPQEMAGHKILDLIGDLSLAGVCLEAHVIGYRSGHEANVSFAKEVKKSVMMELKN